MKKRVCAYARVSTKSRSQEHSFEFQSAYWNDKLGNDSNYEYVGLYADRGISGKSAERRPKFMQMVQLVRNRQVDLIFCKSVQRFARNTEELLSFVREFRELGVGVIFEKENINTLTNGNDLYLTIAAAVAEDDLYRYSQNVKWALKDKFRKGDMTVNGRIYGYSMGKDKRQFEVIESEAVIVRKIFEMYLNGASKQKIADELNNENIPSALEGKWSESSINSIIKNEKYVGDVVMQKRVRTSTGRINNVGQEDKYLIENHHTPIISRELWDKVQDEIVKRANPLLVGIIPKRYPFTGLIKCGCCGNDYRHKVSHSYYTKPFDVWICRTPKAKCPSVSIKDTELKELFTDAYNEFVSHKYAGTEEQDIKDKTDVLKKEQQELSRLNANGWISKKDFITEYEKLKKEINVLSEKLNEIQSREISDTDFRKMHVFDETKVDKFLLGVTITGTEVSFEFYNGVILKRQITQTRIYQSRIERINRYKGEKKNEI